MRILILGGTRFLGRHLINSALKFGHEVTTFTRGREKINISREVEQLFGDRKGNLNALKGKTWDRVIDTSGYVPWDVEKSAKFLADNVEHYTFISSISVYADFEKPKIDESTSVDTITTDELQFIKEEESNEAIMKHYGALKYLCEMEAKKAMPGRVLNVRPGLIVGQYDPTDRFTYWVDRISKAGEVLCPGRKEKLIQFIHAKDLADWIVKSSGSLVVGEYNATGPDYDLTMEEFLEKCKRVCKSTATLTWINEEFLLDKNVQFWSEMPLWIPDKLNNPGFLDADITKALKVGLKFSTLEYSIVDTLNWINSRTKEYKLKAGISIKREAELLEQWKSINSYD